MSTNKIDLYYSVEELNYNYVPAYQSFWRYIANTRIYQKLEGKTEFKEMNLAGDGLARMINLQDSEIKAFHSNALRKNFNNFLFYGELVVSDLQSQEDLTRVANQILENNTIAFDEATFCGNVAGSGDLLNNSFWNSVDPNFVLNSGETIATNYNLNDLKALLDKLIKQSEETIGSANKVIALVGGIAEKLGIFGDYTGKTYLQHIKEAYASEGKNVEIVVVQSNIVNKLASNNNCGIAIFAPNYLTLHYSMLPAIEDRGYDNRKKINWIRIGYSSSMVSVDLKGALIKQPITIS